MSLQALLLVISLRHLYLVSRTMSRARCFATVYQIWLSPTCAEFILNYILIFPQHRCSMYHDYKPCFFQLGKIWPHIWKPSYKKTINYPQSLYCILGRHLDQWNFPSFQQHQRSCHDKNHFSVFGLLIYD